MADRIDDSSELVTARVRGWVARVTGADFTVESMRDHGPRGPWRIQARSSSDADSLMLRLPVPRWISREMVTVNANALVVAQRLGLATPRLVAADLVGDQTGVPATLETFLPGSSTSPPSVSPERLRAAGAAIAKVHAVRPSPQERLPLRTRHTQVDDHPRERRWATLYRATPAAGRPAVVEAFREASPGHTADSAVDVLEGPVLTPLLLLADEAVRSHRVPDHPHVFLHGDVWPGNMLWQGDECTSLIDWKTAGVGDPGADLGDLRMHMALLYGPDAAGQVLDGWETEAGREATDVAYWDVVAAVNTPAEMDGPRGFDADGIPVALDEVTRRRDAFLRAGLDALES